MVLSNFSKLQFLAHLFGPGGLELWKPPKKLTHRVVLTTQLPTQNQNFLIYRLIPCKKGFFILRNDILAATISFQFKKYYALYFYLTASFIPFTFNYFHLPQLAPLKLMILKLYFSFIFHLSDFVKWFPCISVSLCSVALPFSVAPWAPPIVHKSCYYFTSSAQVMYQYS